MKRKGSWQIEWVGYLGVLLFLSEIWKQCYVYIVVGNHSYNWWYFPFQLCSLPIYFAPLLLILKKESHRQLIANFLHDFNLLGAMAVFLDTSGMIHVYPLLTFHSFAFHIALIVIGVLIHTSDAMDTSLVGFGKTIVLFFVTAMIAVTINSLVYPRTTYDIDMFYINCAYPNSQIVFRQINQVLPTVVTNAIYLLSIVVGAGLLHLLKWNQDKK